MGSETTKGARPLSNLVDIEMSWKWFREPVFDDSNKTTTTTTFSSSHLLQRAHYYAMKTTEMYTCREHRTGSYLLSHVGASPLRLRRSSKPYWSAHCGFSSSNAELLRTPQARTLVSENSLVHQPDPGE